MRYDQAAILTDLDGTLFDSQGNVTKESRAAIRAFIDSLRHMEKLEICPYHPLGLEKCAKFGLAPRYAEKAQPTSADLARWRAALRT